MFGEGLSQTEFYLSHRLRVPSWAFVLLFRTYLSWVEGAERVALTYDPLLVGDLFFELVVIERHKIVEIVGLLLDALDMMRLE